jgi:hypothetical protein
MLSSDRFKDGLNRLSAKFGAIPDQGQFFAYCQKTFSGPAEFDKACDLVLAQESSFPSFSRFGQLFEGYKAPRVLAPKLSAVPKVVASKPAEVSYHCLCCLDTGLLSNPTLQAYLNIANSTVPQAYACTRCDVHHKYPYGAVRHVSQNDCEQIHQAELERRRQGSEAHVIARLKSKVQVAGYLNRPDIREQAIAEATQKGIALTLIGISERVAA